MGKSLVIVESPAKAKTINKYLGKDFVVKSSVGHVRDLPTGSNKPPVDPKERARQAAITRKMSPEDRHVYKKLKERQKLIERMGVDPENDWIAQYEVLPGKSKVVNELKELASKADAIYLATDLDREGEAIAWHLRQVIGEDEQKYRRVVFNEITKNAIQEAFQSPSDINQNRVNAQQARRFLDRVVGFMVSPLLWAKIARNLSAGRVQSVAVRLIVEREREIRAFVPEEYWELYADLTGGPKPLRCQALKYQGKEFKPQSQTEMDEHLARLQQSAFEVSKREDKPTKSKPNAPFITSTLQQAASTRLGFSVKKTMTLAQRLYEAGFITYMRTDSTNLSQDAINGVREYVEETFGEKFRPEKPRFYSSKEGAQEAHEAIRPTNVMKKGADLNGAERDAQRLYDLVWQRFVACQMSDAEFTSTSIHVKAGEYDFKTRGRIIRFEGHLKAMPAVSKSDEDVVLPDVEAGQQLNVQKLDPKQLFTKPAPRYTEASLVKELEKRGIGRPSTYASIISTIQDRGYVKLETRRFYAEKMGEVVTSRLLENFTDLMDYSFTANMEERLDAIAEGEKDWKQVLDQFYEDFQQKLDKASDQEEGMRPNAPVPTDIECPKCGRNMVIRVGSTGVFLGCSGYSLPPKERCTQTINLTPGEEAMPADEDAETQWLMTQRRCSICSSTMDDYLVDEKRKLHICSNSPDCLGYDIELGSFKLKGYDGPTLECDKCGSEMQLKTGRFGKYFGCTNETCKNTRKLLKNGEPAPPKMDPIPMPELKCQKVDDTYVLRDGASGLFLAASQFPKNRETRAPLIQELVPHKDELPTKYVYLALAPKADPDGNPALVKFSRKTKEQYVASEVEGKASGWSAHYVNGKWEEKQTASRRKTASK